MKLETTVLLETILSAGVAIEALRKKEVIATLKENQSPLTEADLLANEILKKNLLSYFPQDGWLSEETKDDDSRFHCQRVWIVDPIDGTKEFIKQIPEYAISVALIEKNQPILAAVYNPATQELFHAIKNQGVWLNGQSIQCRHEYAPQPLVLASRSEIAEGKWQHFENELTIKQTGSIAYKLALVAKGAAHATFSLAPKSEWDIAAGVLLVEEAGGRVSDLAGHPLIFNQRNILVNGLLASSAIMFEHNQSLLSRVTF